MARIITLFVVVLLSLATTASSQNLLGVFGASSGGGGGAPAGSQITDRTLANNLTDRAGNLLVTSH